MTKQDTQPAIAGDDRLPIASLRRNACILAAAAMVGLLALALMIRKGASPKP